MTSEYVDLHLHLLPGVDDGPATLEESLEHAHRLAAAGVREVTVTPHVGHPAFPLDIDEIPDRTADLQRAVAAAGIGLRLHPGGEVHADAADDLTVAQLDLVAHGPAGRRWILLEAPFAGISDAFVATVAGVLARGLGVLVAHPERSTGFWPEGFGRLRPLLGEGVLLQVNACSLLGRYGAATAEAAGLLVRTGIAAVIASDGHGGRRNHTLAAGWVQAVRAGASETRARQLTSRRPARLLTNGIAAPVVLPPAVVA